MASSQNTCINMEPTTKTKIGFFDLPPELRHEIYSYLFVSRHDTVLTCFGQQPMYQGYAYRRLESYIPGYEDLRTIMFLKKARSLCHQMKCEVDEFFTSKHEFQGMMAHGATGTKGLRQCVSHHIWRQARHVDFEYYVEWGVLEVRSSRLTLTMDKQTGRWACRL
ncbi:hypothetical protein CLAFUW4_13206 [Fulvia fulva]|uniref:F-box domain-containing protein n=1 Tax=Passalora fulva TaxID=5499 RepID=A0A9Q8PKH2_PASFU|nr:uncharacterized protein CLAFUR5_13062 [Fulvia fulva]KAK4611547.1 hypothetical protein CLAFUR4_13211 [Fulvia fulva]KAK4612919.1 hypothetical protein CLAFUR0_13215 [Fulvia fulva]UJO24077.1 hypothetical protein CLAFUR5_13062 [Fulvia fulva]WPV21519.1 hypothetical protein CLAFUW4_13206 [Fulvia fulva]WPV35816.1 hypothetical protein CLAFUW7_13214 [Fulvia fulva]